jgi:hypothetical protein
MNRTKSMFAIIAMAVLPNIACDKRPTATQPGSPPNAHPISTPAASSAGCPASPFSGDAVVAVVKDVDDKNATFDNPPRVKLEILEVLRGEPATDRSRAIWAPPDHGIDWGIVNENPLYKKWAKTPMVGPKAGEKYILWGWTYKDDSDTRFRARGRALFSDDKRQQAIKMIKRDQVLAIEYQRKMEAEKAAHLEAVRQWRKSVSSEDIKQYAAQADFIGIGKRCSDSFQITTILKGQQKKEFTDGAYYVAFEIPQAVAEKLDRDTTYAVFLQETTRRLSASAANYAPISLGDGVVIADEETMKALTGLVGRKPTLASMPATSQAATPIR